MVAQSSSNQIHQSSQYHYHLHHRLLLLLLTFIGKTLAYCTGECFVCVCWIVVASQELGGNLVDGSAKTCSQSGIGSWESETNAARSVPLLSTALMTGKSLGEADLRLVFRPLSLSIGDKTPNKASIHHERLMDRHTPAVRGRLRGQFSCSAFGDGL